MFPILFYCGIRFAKDFPSADIKISHGEFHIEFSTLNTTHAINFAGAVSLYQSKVRTKLIGLVPLPYKEIFEESQDQDLTSDQIFSLLLYAQRRLLEDTDA